MTLQISSVNLTLDNRFKKYRRKLEAVKRLVEHLEITIPAVTPTSPFTNELIDFAQTHNVDFFEIEELIFKNPELGSDPRSEREMDQDWADLALTRDRRMIFEAFLIYLYSIYESLQRELLSFYLYRKRKPVSPTIKLAQTLGDFQKFVNSIHSAFKDNAKKQDRASPRNWNALYRLEEGERIEVLTSLEKRIKKLKDTRRNPLVHENEFRTEIWNDDDCTSYSVFVKAYELLYRYLHLLYSDLEKKLTTPE